MNYFNLYQIILLIFLGVTNFFGFSLYHQLGGGADEEWNQINVFYLWCIFTVIALGIYFYLGTIILSNV